MSCVIIVMGVAGCGKTTVGRLLATRMQAEFDDADGFHSDENKQKMAGGTPLTDEDRRPWLESMRSAIDGWLAGSTVHVLACSALKEKYRLALGLGTPDVHFVYLKISAEVARQRLNARRGHYMHSNMVESQFAALEEPSAEEALIIEARGTEQDIVDAIVAALPPS